MKKHPKVYPAEDIAGIQLGRDLLNRGYELFSKYDETTKQLMVDIIYRNEMWYVDYIYSKAEEKN